MQGATKTKGTKGEVTMSEDTIVWGISQEDISKSRLVDAPSWLPTEIVDFAIEDAKNGNSKNVHLTVKVFAGEYKGMENPFIYFSEKLPVLMAPLLDACRFPKNENGSYAVRLSKGSMIGKKVLAHWVRGSYNNKPVNNIDDWAMLPDGD